MHPHRHPHHNVPGSQAQGWHKDSYWGYLKIRNHHPWWAMAFYYPQDVTEDIGPTAFYRVHNITLHLHTAMMKPEFRFRSSGYSNDYPLRPLARAMANRTEKHRFMLKFQFHSHGRTETSYLEQRKFSVDAC